MKKVNIGVAGLGFGKMNLRRFTVIIRLLIKWRSVQGIPKL